MVEDGNSLVDDTPATLLMVLIIFTMPGNLQFFKNCHNRRQQPVSSGLEWEDFKGGLISESVFILFPDQQFFQRILDKG